KYKTKRGLNRHQSIVQKYNIHHEGLYVLPLEAVNQFKNDLIYIIGSKLKGHFTQSRKQTLSFSCLESLFFEVFKGYIHYFNRKNKSYKCLFHGPDAYMQLASIFDNQNWGRKFFDNGQQIFILLFDAQAEKRSASNSKKRSEFPKLTVEWKTKHKKDTKNNQTSVGYMYLNFYILQI
ncbi:6284_t:CDS:1, partial [Gigaspora margarita]